MKYKVGDRVEIVGYSAAFWCYEGKKRGRSSGFVMHDMEPKLVGKKATIIDCTEPQPGHESYALDIDGYGYRAWFGLKQLKKLSMAGLVRLALKRFFRTMADRLEDLLGVIIIVRGHKMFVKTEKSSKR